MMDVLSEAELGRMQPYEMKEIEYFFEVSTHPNPEQRVVSRIDWLSPADYTLSDCSNGQLEIAAKTFFAKAIQYLGCNLLKCLLGMMQQLETAASSVAETGQKVSLISTSLDIGRTIVRSTSNNKQELKKVEYLREAIVDTCRYVISSCPGFVGLCLISNIIFQFNLFDFL